jgi:hypothetical protein
MPRLNVFGQKPRVWHIWEPEQLSSVRLNRFS